MEESVRQSLLLSPQGRRISKGLHVGELREAEGKEEMK